jgi:hypothetical protein
MKDGIEIKMAFIPSYTRRAYIEFGERRCFTYVPSQVISHSNITVAFTLSGSV